MTVTVSQQAIAAALKGGKPKKPWPKLREDLTLHPGPADSNGAATWTLHDPARNQYFSIDWVAFEIISRLPMADAKAIAESINSTTTLKIEPQDIEPVLTFIEENELIARHDPQLVAWLKQRCDQRKTGFLQQLIHNYLFFRLPLFRVDRFLEYLIPHIQFVWTPFFFKLTGIAFLAGLWGAVRQWDVFSSTLVDTFSWEGLAAFAGALIAVKVLHEFGHGLTAKRFGCRVPTMGVAFLVMFPMAYTDVTEAWKLDSHKKRLIISSAGIATELVVAAWMLLAWSVLPDGWLRSASFFLATTSIVGTLAINASPFLRFDGYFLLCDFMGMSNLHQRSFAITRWWLREKLFRLGDPPPEVFTEDKQSFLVLFACFTWLYRLVVFLGIAMLVYTFFFKLLGIILMIVELWYFIFRPVWREAMEWRKRWGEIGPVVSKRPAFYLGLLFAAILFVPLDFTVNSQGLLKPEAALKVITFQPSQVIAMPPPVGTRIEAGAQIMAMESPELKHKIALSQVKVQSLIRQAGSAGFDAETVAQQGVLREQLTSAQEELGGLLAEEGRLTPFAQFAGRVADVDPDLYEGGWFPKGAHLLTVINDQSWVVDTYITESELSRISTGSQARFVPQGVGLSAVWGEVISIDRDATRVLADGPLASIAGGEVLVREQNNRIVPERSIYKVRVRLNAKPGGSSVGALRGSVVILGYPKSIMGDLVRGSIATLVRESGF
jgi:putative peptide zinc metalloprotease protein